MPAHAIRLSRADAIRGFALKSNGFEVCHEITANTLRRGHEIKELPISYCARSVDEGVKSSWKDFIKQLRWILIFRFSRLSKTEGSRTVSGCQETLDSSGSD